MIKIKQQSGMSIVSAIFFMVVLGFLGVYMTSLNTMQHAGTSLTLQSHRSFYAAESGLEWFAWFVTTNGSCPAIDTNFPVSGFTVNIDACNEIPITEGSDSYSIFNGEITASTTNANLGDTEFASRTLRTRIIDL